MRGKDHLHYLIHSLSKSEKRYFTMDARKSGRKQSRYLELFHFINKQTEYDEAALKKKFGKKLADDKSRLYEALLSSLRDYQSSKSYKTRIKELLTDAKILFERKLYEQCENRLSEAKSLALELQDHLAVLEINLRQRQLIKEYQHKDYAEQVEQLIEEKEHHLKIVQEEFWLHDNYDRLSVDYVRYHTKLNEENAATLKEKYSQVLNYNNQDAHFFNNLRYHKTLALFYRLVGDTEKEFLEFETTANLWKENSKILSENYFSYLGDIFNLLSMTSRNQERFDQLPALISSLEEEEKKKISQQAEGLLFRGIANYQLIYLINSKNTNIDPVIARIAKGLKENTITPTSEYSILINSVILLFLNDRYDQCLEWLKKIWGLKKKAVVRQDIQEISRVLQLMAIYKSGTIEEVENTIRSGKRYFKSLSTKTGQNKLYDAIAESVAKSYNFTSKREIAEQFHALMSQVDLLQKELPGGIDELTKLWAESIASKTPISILRTEGEKF